jgi:hypothetical protein
LILLFRQFGNESVVHVTGPVTPKNLHDLAWCHTNPGPLQRVFQSGCLAQVLSVEGTDLDEIASPFAMEYLGDPPVLTKNKVARPFTLEYVRYARVLNERALRLHVSPPPVT